MHRVFRILLLVFFASACGLARQRHGVLHHRRRKLRGVLPYRRRLTLDLRRFLLPEFLSRRDPIVTVLQEINARSSRDQSTANLIAATLATLESEIDARMSDDTRLLEESPSLDALHRLTEIWTEIRDSLSASTRDFGSGEELDFFQTEDALWRSPSASAEGRIPSV